MEIIHDGTATQVEQILALATIAGAPALPVADMRQRVLDGHALTQFGPARWRLLPRAQLRQVALVRMETDAAPASARGTALTHGTGSTDSGREVDDAARREGQLDLGGTADALARPIEGEGRLRETGAVTDRPGLAVDGERAGAFADPSGC